MEREARPRLRHPTCEASLTTDHAQPPGEITRLEPVPKITDDIADGQPKRLDPRWIQAEIVSGWIGNIIFAALLLTGIVALWLLDVLPAWADILGFLAWVAINLVAIWLTPRWPTWDYERSWYILSLRGIEIQRGIIWRSVTNVPRSRVQHTDVTQGPIERRYGIARLKIHTAGTENATVELGGLAHETALRIRDSLLAEGSSNAV
jgi:membrane protein YdbS with pleckstrin-like domain